MAYSTNFSIEELRFDNYGLIPAIAQDWLDGSILMLAWMNKESLNKTLETKDVHYWSRSRSELWRKGATSGSTQILKEIRTTSGILDTTDLRFFGEHQLSITCQSR